MDIAFIILKHLQLKKQNHQKYKYLKLKYILSLCQVQIFSALLQCIKYIVIYCLKSIGYFLCSFLYKILFYLLCTYEYTSLKGGELRIYNILISFIIGIYCMFYKCDYSKIVWILIKFLEKYYYKPCIINIPEVK